MVRVPASLSTSNTHLHHLHNVQECLGTYKAIQRLTQRGKKTCRQASGGCKTDWAGRCNAQCIGEASQKGYKCKDIDSDITGSNCFIGWSTCECTCFY